MLQPAIYNEAAETASTESFSLISENESRVLSLSSSGHDQNNDQEQNNFHWQPLAHPKAEPLHPAVKANMDYWFSSDPNLHRNMAIDIPYNEPEENFERLVTARRLQNDQDYHGAFILYCKVLDAQLSSGGMNYFHSEVHNTIGHIISLLFDQYPHFARTDLAKKSPNGCQVAAFKKLPLSANSDLETLVAVRVIADWYSNKGSNLDCLEAERLYVQIHDIMAQSSDIGPHHIEAFRVVRKCAHVSGLNVDRPDGRDCKIVEEEMLRQALEGFNLNLGRTHHETLDCAHALGRNLTLRNRHSDAIAFLNPLYLELLDELGDNDDRTLRMICTLYNLYQLTGRNFEGRRLVWNVLETRNLSAEVLMDLSFSDSVSDDRATSTPAVVLNDEFEQLRVEETTGRRKRTKSMSKAERAFFNQSGLMSVERCPRGFRWESRALYSLSIRSLHFDLILPSHSIKSETWLPLKSESNHRQPPTLRYSIQVVNDRFIDVTVPYIPYSHFLQSQEFKAGLPYREYIKADFASFWEAAEISADLHLEDKSCPVRAGSSDSTILTHDSASVQLPTYIVSLEPQTANGEPASPAQGFFNGIPCDTVILTDQSFHGVGCNLVSSQWVDCKNFIVYPTSRAFNPKLILPDGSSITSRGYITGTWTNFNAYHQRSALTVFIFDVVFTQPNAPEIHHFVFNSRQFEECPRSIMTSDERRLFSASLNPTLWCLANPILVNEQTSEVEIKSEITVGPPEDKDDFWGEMRRRDRWDRQFEDVIASVDSIFSVVMLEEKKRKESSAREEWDRKFGLGSAE